MLRKARKDSPQHVALQQQRKNKQQKEEFQKQNRDRLCVPPKYPGKPELYSYYIAEACRLKKQVAAAESRRKESNISAAHNKAEIKAIEKILADRFKMQNKVQGLDGVDIRYMTIIYDRMVDKTYRNKHKNPLDRYSHIVNSIRTTYKVELSNAGDIAFVVLTLLKSHLEN